jgi:hypothetical protein
MPAKRTPKASGILLAVPILLIGACSALPFAVGPSGIVPVPTPAVLSRCDPSPTVLCLVSFGVQEPDQMLMSFYVPPDSLQEFYVKIIYKQTRVIAPCVAAMDSPTVSYCTGVLVPLGTTIGLEVYATKSNVLLARGEFVVAALALPTQMVASTSELTSTAMAGTTPLPLGTPTTGTLFSTLTPQGVPTRTPTRTPPAGTSYPN